MPKLVEAAKQIHAFEQGNLTERLANLEVQFEGINKIKANSLCSLNNIDESVLSAAITLKNVLGQIDVIVHALGILLLLPKVLQKGEIIESLSLGAGNTGKQFDLQTDIRVAEFKFIHWKGGAEAIRQNSIFKDFFELAEYKTSKKRCLYVLGLEHPLRFFTRQRKISSVLSHNIKLLTSFRNRYGKRFQRVYEYYNYRKNAVEIIDIYKILPCFPR